MRMAMGMALGTEMLSSGAVIREAGIKKVLLSFTGIGSRRM